MLNAGCLHLATKWAHAYALLLCTASLCFSFGCPEKKLPRCVLNTWFVSFCRLFVLGLYIFSSRVCHVVRSYQYRPKLKTFRLQRKIQACCQRQQNPSFVIFSACGPLNVGTLPLATKWACTFLIWLPWEKSCLRCWMNSYLIYFCHLFWVQWCLYIFLPRLPYRPLPYKNISPAAQN